MVAQNHPCFRYQGFSQIAQHANEIFFGSPPIHISEEPHNQITYINCHNQYRLGPVNSKSFIGQPFLRIKWIFTAHICSMREGNIYTWECLSPHHCRGRGGTPSQVGGYPISGTPGQTPGLAGGGYPIPGLAEGGTPSQVWLGGTPCQVWLRGGTPSQVWWGVPHLRSGRGYPISGWGVPLQPGLDGGYPGYPLPRSEMGYPPT